MAIVVKGGPVESIKKVAVKDAWGVPGSQGAMYQGIYLWVASFLNLEDFGFWLLGSQYLTGGRIVQCGPTCEKPFGGREEFHGEWWCACVVSY